MVCTFIPKEDWLKILLDVSMKETGKVTWLQSLILCLLVFIHVTVQSIDTKSFAEQQHALALNYYKVGKMKSSIEHLKASLEVPLDSSNRYFWNNGIEIYRKAGHFMEALSLQHELLNFASSPLSKIEIEMAHNLVNSLMIERYFGEVRDFFIAFQHIILSKRLTV